VKNAGGGRILYNEELHNLYVSSDIFRVIISRWMRWVGHVASIEAVRHA
jgi:hypothetical protein